MPVPCRSRRSYFNPRPPRGGRPKAEEPAAAPAPISIHALREEGDTSCRSVMSSYWNFNPRPPRGGRRTLQCRSGLQERHFNPRPPRGGRPSPTTRHTPLQRFQSTPSARRATGRIDAQASDIEISIHALREEGDSKSGEKIHHVCSIIHTCAQFEKELYEGSGEMQNKSC